MTVEQLAQIAGVVLSLVLAYIPPAKSWFDGQAPSAKAGIMAGLLALVALGAYGLSCAGFAADFNIGVTCDQAGALALVKIFVNALIANQLAYIAAVRPFNRPAPAVA
jgi:hypothetical protein